ncbi:unnamed protein product [Nippostrongylus brasiliensis]|uniref:Zinc transporter ZIP9 (inferred by orthology to a human protein) n=1 Tax=Nippostrongylus brasiliensis TaxID=27835 RepID=A0A0N4YKH0_NIPBR|nr:unnamed protein product [Nippostrongylus brasiliensis]
MCRKHSMCTCHMQMLSILLAMSRCQYRAMNSTQFQPTMEGIGFLTVLSGSMFLGSYFAGSVPMMFSMSESRMRMVSIFGAGLLLGTALSVIIPEGVESLYNAQEERASLEFHGIVNPGKAKSILEGSKQDKNELPGVVPKNVEEKMKAEELRDGKTRKKRDISAASSDLNSVILDREKREQPSDVRVEEHHSHEDHSAHQKIGFSLVFGFIFMLLVDQISNAAWSANDRSGRNRMGVSATIGLVVHAAGRRRLPFFKFLYQSLGDIQLLCYLFALFRHVLTDLISVISCGAKSKLWPWCDF